MIAENAVMPNKKLFKKKKTVYISQLAKYIILGIITVIVFLPILITLFASFKTPPEIAADFP